MMDVTAFMNSLTMAANRTPTSSNVAKGGTSSLHSPSLSSFLFLPSLEAGMSSEEQKRDAKDMTEEEIQERQKKFETFLHRQQQVVKRKEEKVRQVRSPVVVT